MHFVEAAKPRMLAHMDFCFESTQQQQQQQRRRWQQRLWRRRQQQQPSPASCQGTRMSTCRDEGISWLNMMRLYAWSGVVIWKLAQEHVM
jgi:hypothetical protein